MESLPAAYRPNPDDPAGQQILVRSDSAGATHAFATACGDAGVGFSFGYAVDARVRDAVEILNRNDGWYPAIESDGVGFFFGVASNQVSDFMKRADDCRDALAQYVINVESNFVAL